MLAAEVIQWVDLVDILRKVDRAGMIDRMQRQGRGVVIDGIVRRPA